MDELESSNSCHESSLNPEIETTSQDSTFAPESTTSSQDSNFGVESAASSQGSNLENRSIKEESRTLPTHGKCNCKDESKNKLRILAIHGYRQNAEVFKQKTGSFRKMVHKWAQFTYVTAPHKVLLVDDIDNMDATPLGETIDNEEYGWFFNRDNKTFRGIRQGGPAIGFEESVAFIEEVFKTEGPFDGLLGFSQGACFVGLLCDLQQRGLINFKFNFAIMASGFKSQSLPHGKFYQELVSLPTLHIYGSTDQIIPNEMSTALFKCFENPQIVTHLGGHYLPASSVQKNAYHSFFKMLIQELM